MNVTIAAFAITTLIVQTQLWANGMWAAYTGGMLVIILLANRQTQLQSKSPAPAFAMLVAQAAVISVLTVVSDHYFLTTMLSFIPVSLSQTALPRRWANFYDGAFLIALATVYGLSVEVRPRLQILLGSGAGFVFIIAFTRLAQSEALARQQLQGANAQLSEYAAQVARLATMRERNRLAREVHDSLGHYLTVINVQLEIVTKLMQSDPARAREAALKAKELAAEGLAEVRRSVSALRPSPLDDQPQAGAVGRLIDEARAAGLIVNFEQSGSTRALSQEIDTDIYRAERG